METLQDNFDFGGLDTGKWSTWGSNTIAIGTNLDLEMTSQSGANGYGGLLSLITYDLTSSYAFCQITDVGSQVTGLEVYPVELTTGSNALSIMISENIVYARKKISGSYTTVGSTVAYDSLTMKWFRVRESGGTTFWEYAADPTSTWTTIASVSNPITVTALTGGITLGTWQTISVTTAKYDSFNVLPNQYIFTWSGYSWNKRIHAGDPANNQVWSASNVSGPDGSGYLTLNLSNAGSAPIGCEIFSVQRGFGYGTYTSIIATELDNIGHPIGFGGMFTFDFTAPPDYREIDVHETRDYNGLTNKQILHSYVYNNSGSRQFVVDNIDISSNQIQTHQLIWKSNKVTFDSFLGSGVSGTNFFHTEQTGSNIPTPGLERVHFNIFVDPTISGYLTVTPIGVVVRSFSFMPLGGFAFSGFSFKD